VLFTQAGSRPDFSLSKLYFLLVLEKRHTRTLWTVKINETRRFVPLPYMYMILFTSFSYMKLMQIYAQVMYFAGDVQSKHDVNIIKSIWTAVA